MAVLYEKRVKGRRTEPEPVFLAEIQPPERGRKLIFDAHRDAPRGFGVKVSAKGRLSFVLRYLNQQGSDRMITIGDFGETQWSLAAARIQAGKLRVQIDAGSDPLDDRREARKDLTVRDAVKRYCEAHRDKLVSGKQICSALKRYLVKPLGSRSLTSVRRKEVIELVEALREKHARTAGLVLSYIKQVFSWAEDREEIEVNPVASIRPKRIGRELAPRKRKRVLNDSEIRAFWGGAEDCGMHKLTALALKFILVTGQRPGEVSLLHRDQITDDAWLIPDAHRGKTQTSHEAPLTATALSILEEAKAEIVRLNKRRKREASGHAFETGLGAPITPAALSRAVSENREVLGNLYVEPWGHWTPHDLRRTCRSGMAAEGIATTVAELVLGHIQQGIVAVYDQHPYTDEKRNALEAWERRLLRIVEGEGPQAQTVCPASVVHDAEVPG
jgi:integrase